jgi:hypothetical protein
MRQVASTQAGRLPALGAAYLRHRYAFLFYTLLLTMAAAPLIAALELTGSLIEFLLALNLLAAVMPLRSPRSRRAALLATALMWAARPLAAWSGHPALLATTLGAWTLIGLFAAAGALLFAMRAARIDPEHLYAALSAYLLAGVFFGSFYWVLEEIQPASFVVSGEFTRMSAIYFSFVTLATLGYGDIVPRNDIARGLAIVEGVGGQLFLAVMVARLVSLYSKEPPAGARQ